MATYRGHELPVVDKVEADLALRGGRLPGLENVEEELGVWEEAGPDYVPKPGQKGFMRTKPMAKYGSSTCVTCMPSKLIR